MTISKYIELVLAEAKGKKIEFDMGVGVSTGRDVPTVVVDGNSNNRIRFTIVASPNKESTK